MNLLFVFIQMGQYSLTYALLILIAQVIDDAPMTFNCPQPCFGKVQGFDSVSQHMMTKKLARFEELSGPADANEDLMGIGIPLDKVPGISAFDYGF
jgi:hypothetical protein